jgi:cellulose synthase/poly-beta-1,6-N-acetylglucosamine synthase-like glycosyltransferase
MNPMPVPGAAPRVSVVIPAYHRTDLLQLALRSVLSQDIDPGDYEVLVVDSSSNDLNVRLVESLQPTARCKLRCLTKKAEGPGPSRNLGVREARARIIAFTDSDCEAAPGWLRAGLAAFDDEGIGLVQGRTVPDPSVTMTSMSRSLRVEAESMFYEGANMFYRRSAFEGTGGFIGDPRPNALNPVVGEDVELAWTLKRAGWRTRFEARALVMHAVLPITPRQWLIDERFFFIPSLAARHPQLREQFFVRYFYDDVQAFLTLGLIGTLAAAFSPWALAAWAPYAVRRTLDPTKARGVLRLARPLLYLPRDLCTFACLLAGSVRNRIVLL